MPRVNVYLPQSLQREISERIPGINMSAVLQGALSELLECKHHRVVCSACAAPVDMAKRVNDQLLAFYSESLFQLDDLVRRGGTAEGAARVLKTVAERFPINGITHIPLPRPTRQNRALNRTRELDAQRAIA